MPDRLTGLQRDVLERFFARERRFFLTGGAALAGYHTFHRATLDLDLFTTQDALGAGVEALRAVATDLGGALESLQSSPDFRRFLLRRGAESIVVDLVRDRSPQVKPVKLLIGAIAVDPADEILANKLCTLLSRAEIRDLVDVRELERGGYKVEDALPAASTKDAGFSAAQLAWVLSQVQIGIDARPPGDVSPDELRVYLEALTARLIQVAFPRPG
jgi:Nucleotidyl transferase AbiEii toxin, Type IV TA system